MNSFQNYINKLNNSFLQDKFAIFATFYATALWLEMAENWETPAATFIALLCLLWLIGTGIDRLKFHFYLVFTTCYFLFFHFPDVANHVNLIIFSNLTILAIAAYDRLYPQRLRQRQDYYAALASPIRIALIAVYFWAGFHKLNVDFLNPYFSCSNSMFLGIVEMMKSSFFNIPVALVLAIVSFIFFRSVVSARTWQRINKNSSLFLIIGIVTLTGVAIVFLLVSLGFLLFNNLTRFIFPLFVLTTSIVVLLWELIGGIILFLPQYQVWMFLFSIFMHLILAPIGFVDFGSLAFALWLTFIPRHYDYFLTRKLKVLQTNFSINLTLIYVFINVFGGLISGLYYLVYPQFNIKTITGILFIISVLIVIAPLVKNFLDNPRSWQGVAIVNGRMPKFIYIFIALLFLYAATPYLGLRTAGNFSMFSNLRTEGATSNHLLLRNNSLKIWNYQEDTVKIIEIDDKKAEIGHKYRPLKNHSLPVVEFKKLIYQWTKAGYKVPLVFEYNNQTFTTSNIVDHPVWRTPIRNWEMIFMDFRVIQPDNGEPNYCRW